MALLKQSTAYTRTFYMVKNSGSGAHIDGKTGASPTVNISKAGGTFAAAGGTVTELTNGWYKVALTTTDTNTLGDLAYHITGTAADTTDFTDQVVSFDTQDAVRLGLSALPNAAAEAAGGLYTRGTGAGQIRQDANGRIDVNAKAWIDGTIPAVNVTGVPKVDLVDWLGVAPNALIQGRVDSIQQIETGTAQAGAAGSITLRSGASSTDEIFTDSIVVILAGTGAGQSRLATSYVGSTKVLSVVPNFVTNPTSSSVYAVIPFGRVDLARWLGAEPNGLNFGRVSATHGMWTNGSVQSGSSNTIGLDSGEESTDDYYNGAIIVQRDQFGSFVNPRKFQARLIIDYNGTTKVATVYPNWAVDPIASDYYEIWPFGAANVAQWRSGTPNALISGRVDANAQVVGDKTGYSLTATGLDSITATDPGGVASTFPQMLVQLWRRMFKKSTLDSGAGELKTYADNGTTVNTTQTVSDTAGVQTQNAAT